MAQNRVIKMYYELKDAKNGEILESNFNVNPIAFLSGKNQILQKLEDEVLNLGEGESKIIKILPQDGVGEYDENAVQTLPKEQFAGIDLQIGMELFGEGEDGSVARVIVKEITDESVSVDFNHPYAGKELEFNVKIVENREATEDEILMGAPEGEHSCCCGGGGHGHGEDHECCGGHGHGEDGGCCGKHNH
ncbi:MAG: peptidylprolyl isomerase [Campylobacter sp.]|nr:peptidylprolyl isomerase [Campylobacter sp.]